MNEDFENLEKEMEELKRNTIDFRLNKQERVMDSILKALEGVITNQKLAAELLNKHQGLIANLGQAVYPGIKLEGEHDEDT